MKTGLRAILIAKFPEGSSCVTGEAVEKGGKSNLRHFVAKGVRCYWRNFVATCFKLIQANFLIGSQNFILNGAQN